MTLTWRVHWGTSIAVDASLVDVIPIAGQIGSPGGSSGDPPGYPPGIPGGKLPQGELGIPQTTHPRHTKEVRFLGHPRYPLGIPTSVPEVSPGAPRFFSVDEIYKFTPPSPKPCSQWPAGRRTCPPRLPSECRLFHDRNCPVKDRNISDTTKKQIGVSQNKYVWF